MNGTLIWMFALLLSSIPGNIDFAYCGGLNHYRRSMQQSRKIMSHSSVVTTLNRAKHRDVNAVTEKTWDEPLYGDGRSVIDDEDQIEKFILDSANRPEVLRERVAKQLFIGGQLVAGGVRPQLPLDEAIDLPIPRKPPWIPGLTDKSALMDAEQVASIAKKLKSEKFKLFFPCPPNSIIIVIVDKQIPSN